MGSSRRRQTRLTFTPLPSSSPAAKGYNKQIQDRGATVGYDGSPSPVKSHKRQDGLGGESVVRDMSRNGVNDDLPTPAATMDFVQGVQSDSEDNESTLSAKPQPRENRRIPTRQRTKQQQLDWSNMRDAESFSPPVKLPSSSKIPSSGIFKTRSGRSNKLKISADGPSGGSDNKDAPIRPLQNNSSVDARQGSMRKVRGSQRRVLAESDDEENDDVIVVSTQNQTFDGAGDSGEDMPTTQGKLKRRRKDSYAKDDFVSSSPPRALESDDDLEILGEPTPKRPRRTAAMANESEEEDVVTPRWRKLQRPRQISREEQEELDEDLDFLGPSSDVEALERQPRSTQSKEKSARQAALERLKRKRSGQPQDLDEQAGSEPQQKEFDELYDDDDEVDDESATTKLPSSRQMFAADEDDEGFIESGDEDTLGVPDGMPIEFTRFARQKPKELFKYAVEWSVQKKINPGFQINDELYALAFRKLDDELRGLASSKFTSSAWTSEFTLSLRARPELSFQSIDSDETLLHSKCDACNRSNHPATFRVQFQGKPYHPQTLEELGGNDDEDEEEDEESTSIEDTDEDDQPAYDHNGNLLAPASKSFYIGRFCMANAETAHALQHWRFHLNEWIVIWLTKNGYLSDEKIVKREKQSTKKRKKEANRITDLMERQGEIATLWRDFKRNGQEARSAKQGRWEGDEW